MSLVGNLEDLGLGDILQIVSLSRKSGVLSLSSRNREGKVVFRDGQVIRAVSSMFRENIGDLLVRKQLTDLATLKKAVLLQKNSEDPPRLGTILAEYFGVSRDAIEAAVKEQVETIVYSFFAWAEGTFAFELGESEDGGSTSFNPLQFMLDQGLNPQWLAMEGSRILDEKRHRGESLEDEAPESTVDIESLLGEEEGPETVEPPAEAEMPTPDGPTVFLLDDDLTTGREMEKALRRQSLDARAFVDGHEFFAALEAAIREGTAPVVLIDLIMPRLNGTGILGGLEILARVRKEYPHLTALVLSDHPNHEAEARVRGLGVPAVLPKPKKPEIPEERGKQALRVLAETVAGLLGEKAGSEAATVPAMFNLGAELLREMGEEEGAPSQERGPESPGLHLLRGMLEELNNPSLGGGIILLVLRFASELMNRAVIFLVKAEEIVGLGQFGIETTGEPADVRVRRMKIPRDEDSVFTGLLAGKGAMKVRLGEGRWDNYLKRELGGSANTEVFLGPILSEGKIVAVIYGDNFPEKKPVGDTDALEIFLSQAGLAMEKALLERRLRGKDAV